MEQHPSIPSPRDVESSIGDFMINGQRSPLNSNGAFEKPLSPIKSNPSLGSNGYNGGHDGGKGGGGAVKTHRVRDSVAEMADDEDDDEGYGELLDSYGS